MQRECAIVSPRISRDVVAHQQIQTDERIVGAASGHREQIGGPKVDLIRIPANRIQKLRRTSSSSVLEQGQTGSDVPGREHGVEVAQIG